MFVASGFSLPVDTLHGIIQAETGKRKTRISPTNRFNSGICGFKRGKALSIKKEVERWTTDMELEKKINFL